MSSGDGWTTCAAGHRHWGLFGAAGLLLIEEHRVILQHRAPWTHEGDRWGIPGGARDSGEDALQAAVREAGEEAALTAADVDPIGLYIDDHDGWAYTTVVARPTRPLHPIAANAESVSVRWHPVAEVAELPLHSGFAAAWERVRAVPRTLYLIVGPQTDEPMLSEVQRTGIAAGKLPAGIDAGGLDWLFPHVVRADSTAGIAAAVTEYALCGQVLTVDHDELARLR